MTNNREPLILPMMMFGKFRGERVAKDKQGNTIIDPKTGKPKKKKVWLEHIEGQTQGIYPSVNHIYVNVGKGRKKLSVPAEDLFYRWQVFAKEWAQDNNWTMTTDSKIVVELTAHFPNDNRVRDVSNAFKLMLDSLESVIYENDYHALPRVIDFNKVEGETAPYFELNIFKKEDEDDLYFKRYGQAGSPLSEDER